MDGEQQSDQAGESLVLRPAPRDQKDEEGGQEMPGEAVQPEHERVQTCQTGVQPEARMGQGNIVMEVGTSPRERQPGKSGGAEDRALCDVNGIVEVEQGVAETPGVNQDGQQEQQGEQEPASHRVRSRVPAVRRAPSGASRSSLADADATVPGDSLRAAGITS